MLVAHEPDFVAMRDLLNASKPPRVTIECQTSTPIEGRAIPAHLRQITGSTSVEPDLVDSHDDGTLRVVTTKLWP